VGLPDSAGLDLFRLGAPWWRVLAALLGTLAFIVLLVRAGARVYRGAALRMGGRVPLREAWRAG
jgi:ABC-2 type transport system permease protein